MNTTNKVKDHRFDALENTDGKLPSRFQIDNVVNLHFVFDHAVVKNCLIHSVRFTKGKVRYDIAIPVLCESESMVYTVIKNVDSSFVVINEEQSSINSAMKYGFEYKGAKQLGVNYHEAITFMQINVKSS
jgi:hypothetical protein